MAKAIKYYSDDELDAKIKEIEALKEARAKKREERLTAGKIAYMDFLIEKIKENTNIQKTFISEIEKAIKSLNSRKEKKKIKGLREIQKLFPTATIPTDLPPENETPISASK